MTLHLVHGDCLDVMATMDAESIDAIVTDPPYMLRFMGKAWDSPTEMIGHAQPNADMPGFYNAVGKGGTHDHGAANWRPNTMQAWHQSWATAALRVAKPGAYLLAFGGTRTVHRLACAVEDAGWIIRDMLVWGYASGFPKGRANLKPAWEPIVMARKPGPLRMLNIDECRIATDDGYEAAWDRPVSVNARNIMVGSLSGSDERKTVDLSASKPVGGRWPANIVLTAPIFDGDVPGVMGGPTQTGPSQGVALGRFNGMDRDPAFYGDSGTYSRFFLVPKASRSDREPVLGGLDAKTVSYMNTHGGNADKGDPWHPVDDRTGEPRDRFVSAPRANHHPTVKPVDLMRHLVRLVTPPGGTVLDPFLGSGTTALAAELEGFAWVGIEKEAEYVRIAEARLNGTQRGMAL